MRPDPHLLNAIRFLTVLPVPATVDAQGPDWLARAMKYFPVVGAGIGAASAIVFLVAGEFWSPLISALLAITTSIALTSALHEDGLADTADSFGGGWTVEKRLAIMKDSRIGTYGAVALILSFAIRAAALAAIARAAPPLMAALAIPAVACLSRGALVWHWHRLPPAKPDGVAAAAGQPNESALNFALVSACLLTALLIWPSLGLLPLVSTLLATGIAAIVFTWFIRKKLSGHTGDTLGATQQISEIAAFCALAMAL